MGTLSGPIVGAAIYIAIDRLLAGWLEQPLLVLGLASIFVMLVLPRGVVGVVNAFRQSRDGFKFAGPKYNALNFLIRLQLR